MLRQKITLKSYEKIKAILDLDSVDNYTGSTMMVYIIGEKKYL
jgi:hypothetical protein